MRCAKGDRYTWSCRSSQSVIDYALYNKEALLNKIHITSMCIDEEKANSCGSDHNRISLQLNICPQHKVDKRVRPAKQHWKTKDKERLEAFSLQLESEIENVTTYEELEECCLKVAEHAIGKTTKTRSTPWFDKTVKTAIAERRTLSRLHRHTKEGTAAKDIAWKQYLEKKRTSP